MTAREQLLLALQARLDQVTAARDWSAVVVPGAAQEALQLTRLLREDDGDLHARRVLGCRG